jgi:hypothetical protein
VFLQVVSLKTHDVPDQQLPVLSGHPDEAGVEAMCIAWDRKGVKAQHFDRRFEGNLLGEEECEGEDFTGGVTLDDRHADTAATEVDGFLSEFTFCLVRLKLNADGQKDGDAIKFAAFSPGRL